MEEADRQTIRNEVIIALKALNKEGVKKCTCVNSIVSQIRNKLGQSFLYPHEDIIHEEIHLLLLNNILMRAGVLGEMMPIQHLKLTEYGRKCLEKDDIIPLDPSGYLEEIKKSLPQIDPVTLEYLSESISSFNRNFNLSSTITLGVASEQAILLLIEFFCCFIENKNLTNLKSYIKKLKDERFVSTKYGILKDAFEKLPTDIKKNLPQNYDSIVDSMFHFIKWNRDETGHPKGGGKDKAVQGANLQAFKSYLITIYKLIDYLKV